MTAHSYQDANYKTDPAEIFRLIKSLQTARSFLSVQLGEDETCFSSVVLDTDLDNQCFTIDQLIPDDGNLRLPQSHSILLGGLLNGVAAQFEPVTVSMHSRADDVHCLNFPKAIYYNQRRQSFRIALPRRINSSVSIVFADKNQVEGRVVDISVNGLGCEFIDALPKTYPATSSILQAAIYIENLVDIECELVCRTAPPHHNMKKYRFGGEFLNLKKSHEREIARTVLSLQLDERKLETKRL